MSFDYGVWVAGVWDPIRKVVVVAASTGEEILPLSVCKAVGGKLVGQGTRRYLITGLENIRLLLYYKQQCSSAAPYYLPLCLGDDTDLRTLYKQSGIEFPSEWTAKEIIEHLWKNALITKIQDTYSRFSPSSSVADDQGFVGDSGTEVTKTLTLPNGTKLTRITTK